MDRKQNRCRVIAEGVETKQDQQCRELARDDLGHHAFPSFESHCDASSRSASARRRSMASVGIPRSAAILVTASTTACSDSSDGHTRHPGDGVLQYKDGQLDGPQVFYKPDTNSIKSKGEFSQGRRVGPWLDDNISLGEILIVPRFQQFELIKSWVEATISHRVDHATSNWKDGALDGDLLAVDKSGNTVIKAHFENGTLNGPFEFLNDQDNALRQVTFENGSIVKDPHTLQTQISDTAIVARGPASE